MEAPFLLNAPHTCFESITTISLSVLQFHPSRLNFGLTVYIAERRVAEVEKGEVKPVPGEEVFRKLHGREDKRIWLISS